MTPLPLLQMTKPLKGFLLAAELQILWPLGQSKICADFFFFFLSLPTSEISERGWETKAAGPGGRETKERSNTALVKSSL